MPVFSIFLSTLLKIVIHHYLGTGTHTSALGEASRNPTVRLTAFFGRQLVFHYFPKWQRDVSRIHKIKFFASLATYNSLWFRHFLRRNGPTAPTAQRNFWKVTLLSKTRRNKYFVARVAGDCATN